MLASVTVSPPRSPASSTNRDSGRSPPDPRTRTAALAILLLLAAPGVAFPDIPPIVDAAFRNMPPVTAGWAYSRETARADGTRIERFDPTAEPAWRLTSVDGRGPTPEELADYERELARREARNPPGENDFAGLVEPQGWQMLGEDDQRVTFGFRPSADALQGRAPADRLRGELTVLKSVPFVESFRLSSTEPFRVKLVARIDRIETEVRMQRLADRVFMPSAVFTRVRGRAFGVRDIDETITLRYSDYRRVGTGPGSAP